MAYDLEIGSATIFMEASDQPLIGKQAVAAVIVNRQKSGKFGPTIAAVCLARLQFSCWNDADPNRERMARTLDDDGVLQQCQQVMQDAMNGAPDPTGGATFYYATSMTTPPSWAASMIPCGQFGSQLFFRES